VTSAAASSNGTAVYAYVSAFVDELHRQGVEWVFVSPGSRSTALALVAHHHTLSSCVILDERSAGFAALGAARATRCPTALICTSGTAVANYLPAVTEASFSGVPLILLTADRPIEVRGWGPGQAIDQVNIFGSHVRWQTEAPIPTATEAAPVSPSVLDGEVTELHGRHLAMRAVTSAIGPHPGPVHVNWPFRMPLEPPSGWFAATRGPQP